MTHQAIAAVLLPGETVLWEAKPVLPARGLWEWLTLSGSFAAAVFGVVQLCLTLLERYSISVKPIALIDDGPVVQFMLNFAVAGIGAMAFRWMVGDRLDTQRTTYALTRFRALQMIDRPGRERVVVATILPHGTMSFIRREGLVALEIGIHGTVSQDDPPPVFAMQGLAPDAADKALPIIKQAIGSRDDPAPLLQAMS